MAATVQQLLAWARGLGLPVLEARMLLEHVSGLDRTRQAAWPETALDDAPAARFQDLAQRRVAGEPVAYLLGSREFFSLEFEVDANVLIPRPETELLVELALERLPADAPCRALDLGTGSGAIAVALARHRPLLAMTAVDRSEAALAVAGRNAARHGAAVRLLASDWYSAVAGERFELIVSNPPYIAAGDVHLEQGDLRFEPRGALTDEADGLAHLRRIVAGAGEHLAPGGWLLFEHGYDQAADCRALLAAAGFAAVQSWQDLAGIERVSGGRLG
ncbi:peptide chain release factor N(5)-glutamine methyltransferase [Chitinimonas koreensis]|uniref:peptide chain release factor N(5)-glutamine methyltransferase n=1 Tax=Chitinimonas koreensis TaxID=356302 RepID=UPI0003F8439A|nr:peptide chain release factor N(5)-glutamine methyltransferase [Chitinimonas koreensis]QNM96842.1 peptide chain release factor N(5)-glutamine methyltransferase [Chitinimonas koreensis]